MTTLSKASKDRVCLQLTSDHDFGNWVTDDSINQRGEGIKVGRGLKVNVIYFDLKVSFRHQMEMINEPSYHSILPGKNCVNLECISMLRY